MLVHFAMGEEDIGVTENDDCTVNDVASKDPYCYKRHDYAQLVRYVMIEFM